MSKKILVIASGNKNKIKEFSEILVDFTVKGYKEFEDFEIEETGKTFYENSLLKAKTVSERLNLPCLADDSGLSVNALNGEPGIYSARYAGDGIDSHNIDKLLNNLKNKTDRTASFYCSIVMYYPNGKIVSSLGKTDGEILKQRVGTGGFGYDPVFYSYDLKKSFGECTAKEKNSVSHRGRAIKELKEKLGI